MKYLFFIGFLFTTFQGLTQDRQIDQLEVLYDQGYYLKVLRKSTKLIADPAYDYSGMPSFYRSLALFRLAKDEVWFKRHNNAIEEAISSYRIFLENERINDYLLAHYQEIGSLKTYLTDLETRFRKANLNGSADDIKAFRLNELKGIKARPDLIHDKRSNGGDDVFVDVPDENPTEKPDKKDDKEDESNAGLSFREKMVIYAKSLVGTKYKWSGTEPDGFDCSGFVSHVHRRFGIIIPRSSPDMLAEAKKVNLADAFTGDLVFFASGSTISHVGLVINTKGSGLVMVHSSTSQGVIITEIEKSSYWQTRLKAAGTFI